MKERTTDHSWDYRNENTKEYTHGIHSYPAMMIPQVARRLINEYGTNAKVLLDPFVGSGSVLIEGMLHKSINRVYGVEINPLAILISKAKTKILDYDALKKEVIKLKNQIEEDITAFNLKQSKVEIPNFKNIDFWFSKSSQYYLSIIKKDIYRVKDEDIRNFLLVCFSEIIRTVSYTRNGEFKLYRMAEDTMKKHNPNVKQLFFEKVGENSQKMLNFINEYKKLHKNTEVIILDEDSRNKTSIPEEFVDLLVTSPPYGDSRTTVAYGQFSQLSSQWVGFEEQKLKSVDARGLGGIKSKNESVTLPSKVLEETIQCIQKIDNERAKEVLSFYEDFFKCTEEINRVMKHKGFVCMVVGNRTVKNVWIETDKIIAELFTNKYNYKHINTIIREIPTKKMPTKNSPSNIKGKTISTMNNEYIVILQKP